MIGSSYVALAIFDYIKLKIIFMNLLDTPKKIKKDMA